MIFTPRSPHPEHGGLLIRLMLGLVLLLGVAVAAGLWMLPDLVAARVHARTGFEVKVNSMSVNPFTGRVAVTGLIVKNPAGWPVPDFIDVREFRAGVEISSLFGGRPVADEVVVNIAQITLVRDQRGGLNATMFKDGLDRSADADHPPVDRAASGTKPGAKEEFLIKHLVMRFDKLVYADYSGGRNVTKEYPLNIQCDLRNVDSLTKLLSPVEGKARSLAIDTLGGMFKNNPDLLKGLSDALEDGGRKIGEKLKGLLDSLDKRKP